MAPGLRNWFRDAGTRNRDGQEQKGAGEYPVMAAFLFNFSKFVEWPADAHSGPGSPVVVCVAGKDPFGESLDRTFRGQTVGGRPFQIVRVARREEIPACHILFVAESDGEGAGAVLEGLRSRHVLTVSDRKDFAAWGGMIGFYREDGRIRFELNAAAVDRSSLKVSSKLIKLARLVPGR